MLGNNVDILILNLRLPIMSGLEVYLELKKHHRVLPTVIVTGHAKEEKESIDRLQEMPVAGCLVKPLDMEELLHSIEKLIESASMS